MYHCYNILRFIHINLTPFIDYHCHVCRENNSNIFLRSIQYEVSTTVSSTFIAAGKFICFGSKKPSDQTFNLEMNQEFDKEGNQIIQY